MRNVQTIPTIKPFPSLPLHHAHCPWYPQHVMAWTHAMVLTLNNRKRASWGQRSPRLWISVCYFCLAHAPFLSKKICQFDTVTAPMLHCLSLLIGTQSFAVGPEKGFWKTIQGQGLCLCLFSWLEFRVLHWWVQRKDFGRKSRVFLKLSLICGKGNSERRRVNQDIWRIDNAKK